MEKEKKSQLYAKKKMSDEQPYKSLEEMENKFNSQRKKERKFKQLLWRLVFLGL